MKKFISVILGLLFLFSSQTIAHPGEHGPVDEAHAVEIAAELARQFIEFDPGLGFGTLDKSWNKLPVSDMKIHQKGNGYYIVSLTNKARGKTLYVLMSIEGEVYDANFSGQFPGLK